MTSASFFFKQLAVVGRDGKMKIDNAFGISGCLRALGKVFFYRSARSVGIGVELKKSFGESAIVHTFGIYNGGDDIAVTSFCQHLVKGLAVETLYSRAKFRKERQVVDIRKQCGYRRSFLEFIGYTVDVFKQRFEHSGSCA